MRWLRMKVAAALCLVIALATAVTAQAGDSRSGPFVFAYFNTGQGEAQGLQLAYSRDGYRWTKIEAAEGCFLKPKVGGRLMRDPSIAVGPDGTFHMVWTTAWFRHGIGIAHSQDLRRWSEQIYLDVMKEYPGYANAWAPEITFDPQSQNWLIYWASTVPGCFAQTEDHGDVFTRDEVKGIKAAHRIYATTTTDFKTYSPTRLFYDGGYNAIDAFIVYDAPRQRWVMVIKDEEVRPTLKKNIRVAFATDLRGPWSRSSPPISPAWVEGPALLKVNQGWLLYYDAYRRHRYEGLLTCDFENWQPITERLQMPAAMRHGTPLPVSEAVLQGLLGAAAARPGAG